MWDGSDFQKLSVSFQPTSPQSSSRKGSQPDNKKHADEEDNLSVTSSYPLLTFEILFFVYFCLFFVYAYIRNCLSHLGYP